MLQKPNLFLIGAMKSGTTTLWSLLKQHPEIFATDTKELRYFISSKFTSRSEREYIKKFKFAKRQKYLLDASPQYSMSPKYGDVARRIHEFNPRAKILYIMRHPLDRLLSQYRYQVWHGFEDLPVLEALCRNSNYLITSYYAHQLRPYVNLFGIQNIITLTTESLSERPLDCCRSIFAKLEIDTNFMPTDINLRLMTTPIAFDILQTNSMRTRLWARLKLYRKFAKYSPLALRKLARSSLPRNGRLDSLSPDFLVTKALLSNLLNPLFIRWTRQLTELTSSHYTDWDFNLAHHCNSDILIDKLNYHICLPDCIQEELAWLNNQY